jgi:hypothetical protein
MHKKQVPQERQLSSEWEVDPATLVIRLFHGIDHFLNPGSILEIPLVALTTLEDLVNEISDEIGVEERPP